MSKVIACTLTWLSIPNVSIRTGTVMRAIGVCALCIHIANMDFIGAFIDIYKQKCKSIRNDDDQSDGHEDDFGWWWWFVVNDVSDDLFWFNLFLSDNQKYLHNIVLDLFPFASDTNVWHNPTVMLHSSITSLL